MDDAAVSSRYPLLAALLAQKGLRLKGTYTNRDVAQMFGVSIRAIQERTRTGTLKARDLPGWDRFLSEDLEEFLQQSVKPRRIKVGDLEESPDLRTRRHPASIVKK